MTVNEIIKELSEMDVEKRNRQIILRINVNGGYIDAECTGYTWRQVKPGTTCTVIEGDRAVYRSDY